MSIEDLPNGTLFLDIDHVKGYQPNISIAPTSQLEYSNDWVNYSAEKCGESDCLRMQFCSEVGGVYGQDKTDSNDSCSNFAIYYFGDKNSLMVTSAKTAGGNADIISELAGEKYPELIDERLTINIASTLSYIGWNVTKAGNGTSGNEMLKMAYALTGNQPTSKKSEQTNFDVFMTDIDDAYLPTIGCVSLFGAATADDKVMIHNDSPVCIQTNSELSNILGTPKGDNSVNGFSPYSLCLEQNKDGYNVFAMKEPVLFYLTANTTDKLTVTNSKRAFQIIMGAQECLSYKKWESGEDIDPTLFKDIAKAKNAKVISVGDKPLPNEIDFAQKAEIDALKKGNIGTLKWLGR